MQDMSTATVRAPTPQAHVGWGFVTLYTLSYLGTCLLFIAPLAVTLALKVNDLVGPPAAPASLALVAGAGSAVSLVGNPMFGRLSDRTSSRWGMRRPWMVGGLLGGTAGILGVATATNIATVVLGWCLAQLFFNAVLAVHVAVLPDQVPTTQRGQVSGVLGVCLPVASIGATFVVKLFSGHQLAMFLLPCAVGGVFIVVFALNLKDRRLAAEVKPAWTPREVVTTFVVNPRRHPDFAWAFLSRFLLVMAYAFLTTYQVYFLLDRLHAAEAEIPDLVFLGTVAQSSAVVLASLVGGRISDRVGRRKVFVCAAALVYAVAMVLLSIATTFPMYLVAVAVSGLGFGLYFAVDLALVTEVLPDPDNAAKDLGVFNYAGAVPFTLAPALAPGILSLGAGSYSVLFAVAAACAAAGAFAVLPVKALR
ncbi:Sugar transporter [Pedococcus cremeus]|uniref:Sugar transporter n=1 Tax=Pedococcus cremeus TaxID=587636 RepID=A0A1H9XS51_9MICO|nr:Sugar transporter [Pedococcus cremeus]